MPALKYKNLYLDPTPKDIERPEFNAVWKAIKGWDIQRDWSEGKHHATGNDVMYILNAIQNYCCVVDQESMIDIIKDKLPVENQHLADDIASAIMQDIVFRKLSAE